MSPLKITYLILFCAFSYSVSCQTIIDDPSFSKTTSLTDPSAALVYSLEQENKSQLVLSYTQIFKIDSMGNNIQTFPNFTFQSLGSPHGLINASSSMIIAYGAFSGYGGHTSSFIVRMTNSGDVDDTFTSTLTGGANAFIEAAVEQPDGKIICSLKTPGLPLSTGSIIRLNTDGSIDSTFNSPYIDTTCQNVANLILLDNGEVLVVFENWIQKLFSDGSVDSSFNTGAIDALSLYRYSDAKLLNDGTLLFMANNHVHHIFSDGSVDNSFVPTNITSCYLKRIILGTDNKIYLFGRRGSNSNFSPLIYRLNADGSYDNSFSVGSGFNDEGPGVMEINSVIPFEDGSVSIVGGFDNLNTINAVNMVKLDNGGNPIWTHKNGTGLNSTWAKVVRVDSNNNIFVGGTFTSYNGSSRKDITKLDSYGHTDYSFKPGTGFNGDVRDILTLPDGKIIVGGQFNTYNGTNVSNVVRLNADGSLDNTFVTGTGFSGGSIAINALGLQSDGKIIVAGDFTYYNNTSVARIIRLLPNGSLDATFTTGSGANDVILDLIVKSSDEIMICGEFNYYNGVVRPKIALLNNNGILNTSFVPVAAYAHNDIRSMAIQNDGKIIVGGDFYSYTDHIARKLGRLNQNGSVDSTFIPNAAMYNFPEALGVLPDGKIIVGSGKIAIINSNGTSITYNNLNTSSKVNDLYINPAGNPILVGQFSLTSNKYGISRLKLAPAIMHTQVIEACDAFTWVNGVTYTSSTNTPQYTFTNVYGVDSIVTLNLTLTSSGGAIIENVFSLPSDPNNCLGEFAVDYSGNIDYELDIDNGSQTALSTSYHLFTNLCPGIHDLSIFNSCGDTTITQFVIPVDSNYVFNNPFIDSLAQDSLGTTLEDCDIYYAGIDTAYIDSIWANGNTVNVIWNIVDSNGSNFDTTAYVLNNGNGVYWLQLSVFCPVKSANDYFTVTEAIYFENGTVSSAGIEELEELNVLLYPNPTNDLVTISFDGHEAQLTIYDAQGKLIRTSGIQSGGTVSLKDVQTGVYFFELSTEKGSVMKRVARN